MGPSSPYWAPYIASGKAIYSMVLTRDEPLSYVTNGMRLLQSSAPSNVTFGYADDQDHINQKSITISSLANYTYALDSFGLGPVYYQDNCEVTSNSSCVAISDYFEPLQTIYPIELRLSFVGMGAPFVVYNTVAKLLKQLEPDFVCPLSQDAMCTMEDSCSTYQIGIQ